MISAEAKAAARTAWPAAGPKLVSSAPEQGPPPGLYGPGKRGAARRGEPRGLRNGAAFRVVTQVERCLFTHPPLHVTGSLYVAF